MTTTCRIPQCGKPIATKKSGLCMRHYKQNRNGTLQAHQSPKVGSPSGHGHYGVLDDDGQRVRCHECGQWLESLGGHLKSHDMTARQYKLDHGLLLTSALMSQSVRDTLSTISSARVGSEAWKRMEAKRDPQSAAAARGKESFHSMARAAGRDSQQAIDSLRSAPPRGLRTQVCAACGEGFQKEGTSRTCGSALCVSIRIYESRTSWSEMRLRARMYEVEGLNFSEIARYRGVTPQAVRIGYRGWQRYQGWKNELSQK